MYEGIDLSDKVVKSVSQSAVEELNKLIRNGKLKIVSCGISAHKSLTNRDIEVASRVELEIDQTQEMADLRKENEYLKNTIASVRSLLDAEKSR